MGCIRALILIWRHTRLTAFIVAETGALMLGSREMLWNIYPVLTLRKSLCVRIGCIGLALAHVATPLGQEKVPLSWHHLPSFGL